MSDTFGAAVKAARESIGLNVTEAAELAGVSTTTWHKIERGEPVRPKTHASIDQAFDLPIGTSLEASRPESETDFGELVRSRRCASGLSIREAARRAGVSEGGWRLIEGGAGNHRDETLRKVEHAIATDFAPDPQATDFDAARSDRLSFAATVRAYRVNNGLSGEMAAERAGVAYKTYLRIESGQVVRDKSLAAVVRMLRAPVRRDDTPDLPANKPCSDFEELARLIPKLELHELNRLSDMVSTAIAIRQGGV